MKYHLARGDQKLGTFSDLDVSAGLRDGRFQPGDLCWTEGMSDWKRLDEHLQEVNPEPEPPPLPDLSALREQVRQDREEKCPLASIWQRLAAGVIDWVVLLLPMLAMLMTLMDGKFEADILAHQNDQRAIAEILQRQVDKVVASGNQVLPFMSLLMMGMVLANTILLTVRGQSIGKWLLGIQIVRFADGSRAGFFKAVLLRGLLFIMVGSVRFIGPFFFAADTCMIFREDRRCLHDLVADTKVVKLRS